MYVGPFVAAWEKIVDIRLILREGAFMFWKNAFLFCAIFTVFHNANAVL